MPMMRCVALLALLALPAHGAGLLNPVFQDHAVLQRNAPIRVWGVAPAGASLTVLLGAVSTETKADDTGTWRAALPPLAAGGPYTLTVKTGAGESQTLSDILVGDVFLCSGQSNMAFKVSAANDAWVDLQDASDASIRLLNIPNRAAVMPQKVLPSAAAWAVAAPETVPDFSAVCYYFARALRKTQRIPLGLISAPWSGAGIASFISAQALRQAGADAERLDALKIYAGDPAAGYAHWGKLIEAWWRQRLETAPWENTASSKDWAEVPQGRGVWNGWGVASLEEFTGHLWFRTKVVLTADQAAQAAELSLGTVNEEDQTWVNGRFIAANWGFVEKRNYPLAAGTLHEGENDILVNIHCSWKLCGFSGPPEARVLRFAGGAVVPLTEPWRYRVVPAAIGDSPAVPWGPITGLTTAYNGMIAPLAPYGLSGVLWYQGEGNAGAPHSYAGLLKSFMRDWRDAFASPELPFLIVQLAGFGQPPFAPEDSNWSRIREAQRLTAGADKNAALIVTIDIGDRGSVHPANKQEVGRRLALAAERLIYGNAAVKPGPQPLSAMRKGRIVTVAFGGINGRLAAAGGIVPAGFELCGARCRFVSATISGDTVRLVMPEGLEPERVRYCWGKGPVCTLYDTSRLPAVPFELAIGKR